ncbi:hypothetical protein BJX65DRAFT_264663 [Aspergillus insuetus]
MNNLLGQWPCGLHWFLSLVFMSCVADHTHTIYFICMLCLFRFESQLPMSVIYFLALDHGTGLGEADRV